jgi:hypothetical protein
MGEEKTFETRVCGLGPGLNHLKTADGAKRFDAAVEQRNQADYVCFTVLRDLHDQGLLTREILTKFYESEGEDSATAVEWASDTVEHFEEALQKRRDADVEFSNALLGRS